MREITQVHIARVPFNIEQAAFKDLKAYLDAIAEVTASSHREELVNEVEARIVELLAEWGIKQDGTITAGDVAKIKQQLGEPTDFADAETISEPEREDSDEGDPTARNFWKRKFYRDEKRGMIGGVCYGLAKAMDINPIWIRLLFVLLIFANGIGVLAYIVLLVLMPEVKNDADRLAMEGKPVNVKYLQWFKSQQAEHVASGIQKSSNILGRVLARLSEWLTAIISVSLAFALFFAFMAVAGLANGADEELFGVSLVSGSGYVQIALVSLLAFIATLLIFVIIGIMNVLLKKTVNKRISASVGLVLTAAVVVLGVVAYPAYRDISNTVDTHTKSSVQALPATIDTLKIDTVRSVEIKSDARPRIEISASFPAPKNSAFTVKTEGTALMIGDNEAYACRFACPHTNTITIYTDRPLNLQTKGYNTLYVTAPLKKVTDAIAANAYNYGFANYTSRIEELNIKIGQNQAADFRKAVIGTANITLTQNAQMVQFGDVGKINIDAPQYKLACSVDGPNQAPQMYVDAFDRVSLNGQDVTDQVRAPLQPVDTSKCFRVYRWMVS